jgi:hypothetical protein
MSQPLSHLPAVLERMAEAATKATDESCRLATEAVKVVVIRQGSRFHIKGRGGKGKFPLVASSDVKRFGKGSGVARGAVFGLPSRLLEDRRGRRQAAHDLGPQEGPREACRQACPRGPRHRLAPQGVRVRHVGRPSGHPRPDRSPWVAAMSEASRVVPETVAATSTKAFVAAFL